MVREAGLGWVLTANHSGHLWTAGPSTARCPPEVDLSCSWNLFLQVSPAMLNWPCSWKCFPTICWHSKQRDHNPVPGSSSLKNPLALGSGCPLCYSKQPQCLPSQLFLLLFPGSLIAHGRWRLLRESPSLHSQPGTDRDIS